MRNARTGHVLARRVRRADNPLARAIGFLTRAAIAPDEGLWFDRCAAVHTLGMRSALDIIFLDADRRIVSIQPNVTPGKLHVGAPGAHITLEFGPGFLAANEIAIGDQLQLVSAP
ncbi:MAG TPA: DUF192 domain-containing protein [Candidatus Elarobacter sp.]|nr:DUF192 domain-containing protein [Candidatus Elarobacter sp.]